MRTGIRQSRRRPAWEAVKSVTCGVEADSAAALKWYRRAAERGYEPARIAIDALAE